jgi:hypothetical protein
MDEIIEQLLDKLFKPERRRLSASLDNLIRMHSEIVNKNSIGFLFAGTFYCLSTHNVASIVRSQRDGLAHELTGEMNSFISDRRLIDLDYRQIRQTLFILLKKVNKESPSLQDCRDLLPDFIVLLVPQLKLLSRQREYISLHNERVIRQTAKTLEKIHVYAVGALLY